MYSLLLAISLGGPPAPHGPEPKLMELVRQLGHDSFQVRETAARELKKRGGEAAAALAVGMKDPNLEVAQRCKLLYPAAAAEVRKANLILLVNDSNLPPPKGLVGIERFLKITGDKRATRQLYAEMMAAGADIVEAMEHDPRLGSRLMGEFLDRAYERTNQKSDENTIQRKDTEPPSPCDLIIKTHGEAALVLFVRSDPLFIDAEEHINVVTDVLFATKLRGALTGPKAVPGIKQLFVDSVRAETQVYVAIRAFALAECENVKEVLPAAMEIVRNGNQPSEYRAELLIRCVAKFGGKEHLKDVAPILADTEYFGFSQRNDEPKLHMQFRDLALFTSIRLSGQKLADFGLREDESIGFPDEAARQAAFDKWKAWTEREQKAAKR